MELYRYVNKKELFDIQQYNRLEFRHPAYWGKNESILTQVFNFDNMNALLTDDNERKKTIKCIKKLIDTYIATTSYVNVALPEFNSIVNWNNPASKMFYDIYTDLMVMLQLSYYCYAKCWSTKRDNWDDTQTSAAKIKDDKNLAYIVADINVDLHKEIEFSDLKGHLYAGNLRLIPVTYKDFGYNSSIDTIISTFNGKRILSNLLCTVQSKYSNQSEYRLLVTPCFYDLKTVGSFSKYISSKYGKAVAGNREDLAEALLENAQLIKENTDQLFVDDDNGYKSLYWKLPSGFIKDIVMKDSM